jgi:ribose 5-phosphate isomerase B
MAKIFLASDHAGFALKEALQVFLTEEGYDVEDLGPENLTPGDDYPDYCMPLGAKVAQNKGTFGIVIGGSGQGEAMAVNRVAGARATVFYGGNADVLAASREHNNANVLSLGARFISVEDAKHATLFWLTTEFSQDERHVRRINKLDKRV